MTPRLASSAFLLVVTHAAALLMAGAAAAEPPQPDPADPLAGVDLLTPNNFRMPSDDIVSPYALESGAPPGPFARLDALRGTHAVVHGALGQMPEAELGQALPGTAPPAGTQLPPGLEQFYVDPNGPPR